MTERAGVSASDQGAGGRCLPRHKAVSSARNTQTIAEPEQGCQTDSIVSFAVIPASQSEG